jgi:D-alanyl-D-alanine carboxypeptidase/D-alanyl-D-alanine-endopeptidase (penicillin-binding protein 4)
VRARLPIACAAWLLAAGVFAGAAQPDRPTQATEGRAPAAASSRAALRADLDAVFSAAAFSRALVAVRVESLGTGEVLYQANSEKLVVPGSNLKLLTLAAAADRLGWNHRFTTTLEAAGAIEGGTLRGDLIVTGGGDPSLISPDRGHPAIFLEWAEALHKAGIHRVTGRLIGDDNAFDDEALGGGWAWDFIGEAYAAPCSALSYNENIAVLRIIPGADEGGIARVFAGPPGTGLEIDNQLRTGAPGSPAAISLARLPGQAKLTVSGTVPAGAKPILRGASIDNPTKYYVEALKLALWDRGISVSGGAWDIDDLDAADRSSVPTPPLAGQPVAAAGIASGPRRLIATRESLPLSSLGAQMMKTSQNFYAEMLLKAVGRTAGAPGSFAAGREVVRQVMADWGLAPDSFVMRDGSGLSRYDYMTADAIVALLRRAWEDERMRGPFVASLPIGAIDGTLENRLKDPALMRRVQGKTGTLTNMRSLSGYVMADSSDRLVFSILVNNYTAPAAAVDAAVEQALIRIVKG